MQINSEAHAHKLEDNLAEANARLAEMERTQTELSTTKIHLTGEDTDMDVHTHCVFLFLTVCSFCVYVCVCVAENNDLSRELEDTQSKLTQAIRLKTSFALQIDELKRQLDEENKVQVK